jgi:hypothetical protein
MWQGLACLGGGDGRLEQALVCEGGFEDASQ